MSHPFAVKQLLELVGHNDLRDTIIQPFMHAVHAPVGDEGRHLRQNIQLGHIIIYEEIIGKPT